MHKLRFDIQEIGLLELALKMVNSSIDRDDLDGLVNDKDVEELKEHYSQGTIDGLLKLFKEFD